MIEITSSENRVVKHIKKLFGHTYREKCMEAVLEGERAIYDCAAYGGEILTILVRDDYTGRIPSAKQIYKTNAKIFDAICETKTPQGIMATVATKITNVAEFIKGGLIVVCDRVQDPGNLGTIFRTAHAVGADGIILIKGCADPFLPKTVRASMGSVFAMPIAVKEELPRLDGYTSFCGTLSEKAISLYKTTFPKKTLLVLGNEANGASEAIIKASQEHILIPMPGGAESLNVAAAGAVMMYEYFRQVHNVY